MNDSEEIKIIYHRGASDQLPENTFEAIHAAMVAPVAGVEFDVDLTKDGVPILIHQETAVPNSEFNALIAGSRDEGRAWTHEYTWEEIQHFDVGTWKGQGLSHIRFARLEEVLAYDWKDKLAVVELKNPYFYHDRTSTRSKAREFAKRIVEISMPSIKSFIAKGGNLQLLSFDTDVVELARPLLPDNEVVLALDPCFPSTPIESCKLAQDLGADSVIIMDKWLFNEPKWLENVSKNKLNLWAFELSPSLEELKNGGQQRSEMELNWIRLRESEIIGFHSDYAVDCYSFYQQHPVRTGKVSGF